MSKSMNQELDALWTNYKKNNDIDTRNKIILLYSYLVKQQINRLGVFYRGYYDIDDLMSYGTLGLIDAIEKFDISKGIKFQTYASFRIRGSIIDRLRQQDWVPRQLRQKAKKVYDVMEEIQVRYGRQATEEELGQRLSMPIDEVRKTLADVEIFNVISLDDEIIDVINNKNNNIPSNIQENPEEIFDALEVKEILTGALDELNEREKIIISLYYYDELTLKEIGSVLGVSESRISQIHSKVLVKLKNKLSALRDILI